MGALDLNAKVSRNSHAQNPGISLWISRDMYCKAVPTLLSWQLLKKPSVGPGQRYTAAYLDIGTAMPLQRKDRARKPIAKSLPLFHQQWHG
jgi:hypothetical protein